jgi:hypothetical protein
MCNIFVADTMIVARVSRTIFTYVGVMGCLLVFTRLLTAVRGDQ